MNITTTARHDWLRPQGLRGSKVHNLKKYFDHIVNARHLFAEKYRQRVEITLHVNGKDFVTVQSGGHVSRSIAPSRSWKNSSTPPRPPCVARRRPGSASFGRDGK
jgi:hypothetical protein